MTDIVEQLRTVDTKKTDAWAICDEAADEIERLREALRGVIRVPDKAALDAARAALGEGEQ